MSSTFKVDWSSFQGIGLCPHRVALLFRVAGLHIRGPPYFVIDKDSGSNYYRDAKGCSKGLITERKWLVLLAHSSFDKLRRTTAHTISGRNRHERIITSGNS